MDKLPLIGRIIFSIPLLAFGFGHFGNASAMAGMVPIPGGEIWVYLTGAALIAAGISIIINKMTRLAALLLGIMLLIFAFSIHLPSMIEGSQSGMASFMKDFAMAGAAFYISGTQD